MTGPINKPPHRRPALLTPSSLDDFGTDRLDPAVITQIAHESAAVIVHTGRARLDPELTDRLVALVDEVGLDTLAELWSGRPARSLPGALWRLYALREWVRRDPSGASADYRAGIVYAGASVVVAGAAHPPGPEELRRLVDSILRGVFEGDLAVALHRASAFCKVVSAGRAARTDGGAPAEAASAASVLTMGDDLEACAKLWQRESLT